MDGFVQIVVFFAILLAGYVYVWRKGVLDWGHERAEGLHEYTMLTELTKRFRF